jgi:hypothetical protein
MFSKNAKEIAMGGIAVSVRMIHFQNSENILMIFGM